MQKNNCHISLTLHKADNRWIVVAINNTDAEIQDTLTFNGLRLAKVYRGTIEANGKIVIPAADAVVFELE